MLSDFWKNQMKLNTWHKSFKPLHKLTLSFKTLNNQLELLTIVSYPFTSSSYLLKPLKMHTEPTYRSFISLYKLTLIYSEPSYISYKSHHKLTLSILSPHTKVSNPFTISLLSILKPHRKVSNLLTNSPSLLKPLIVYTESTHKSFKSLHKLTLSILSPHTKVSNRFTNSPYPYRTHTQFQIPSQIRLIFSSS